MARSAFVPSEALLFFNPLDAAVVDAFAEQILPSEEGSPGARDAGVVYYIDRALAGFMRELQPLYRRGLQALRILAVGRFGADFSALEESQQRERRRTLGCRCARTPATSSVSSTASSASTRCRASSEIPPTAAIVTSWAGSSSGFPALSGATRAEQMRPGVDARSIPILTVGDLYSRIREVRV